MVPPSKKQHLLLAWSVLGTRPCTESTTCNAKNRVARRSAGFARGPRRDKKCTRTHGNLSTTWLRVAVITRLHPVGVVSATKVNSPQGFYLDPTVAPWLKPSPSHLQAADGAVDGESSQTSRVKLGSTGRHEVAFQCARWEGKSLTHALALGRARQGGLRNPNPLRQQGVSAPERGSICLFSAWVCPCFSQGGRHTTGGLGQQLGSLLSLWSERPDTGLSAVFCIPTLPRLSPPRDTLNFPTLPPFPRSSSFRTLLFAPLCQSSPLSSTRAWTYNLFTSS